MGIDQIAAQMPKAERGDLDSHWANELFWGRATDAQCRHLAANDYRQVPSVEKMVAILEPLIIRIFLQDEPMVDEFSERFGCQVDELAKELRKRIMEGA